MKLKHLLLISAVAMSFAACDDDELNQDNLEISTQTIAERNKMKISVKKN